VRPAQSNVPGGVCPCPHYGYIFEGRLRAKYPGSDWLDEVIEALADAINRALAITEPTAAQPASMGWP